MRSCCMLPFQHENSLQFIRARNSLPPCIQDLPLSTFLHSHLKVRIWIAVRISLSAFTLRAHPNPDHTGAGYYFWTAWPECTFPTSFNHNTDAVDDAVDEKQILHGLEPPKQTETTVLGLWGLPPNSPRFRRHAAEVLRSASSAGRCRPKEIRFDTWDGTSWTVGFDFMGDDVCQFMFRVSSCSWDVVLEAQSSQGRIGQMESVSGGGQRCNARNRRFAGGNCGTRTHGLPLAAINLGAQPT